MDLTVAVCPANGQAFIVHMWWIPILNTDPGPAEGIRCCSLFADPGYLHTQTPHRPVIMHREWFFCGPPEHAYAFLDSI
jgi:hypothetical protein